MEQQKTAAKNKGKLLLATVKGDVHDIGKNIVGVVLQCNHYDILDLGVMVPANKILETAKTEKVDIIGLSGLITPSLEEMQHIANEMTRLNFNLPLLIGGATTSKMHTAVKIAPNYSHPVIYVKDASRAVGVVSQLLNQETHSTFVSKTQQEYETLRQQHAGKKSSSPRFSLTDARKNQIRIDWHAHPLLKPQFLGTKTFLDYPLEELVDYIDWTPFFKTWELAGRFPQIFEDPTIGDAAKQLYADAKTMLHQLITERTLTARAVIGFFPANSEEETVMIYENEDRRTLRATFHFIRQQMVKQSDKPNLCLADYIAPRTHSHCDYIGLFAVTAGIGVDALVKTFEAQNDMYNSILVKALADRLAEALAERMHERVRKEFWAYMPNEQLDNEQLIQEAYQGIRPAPGYPACPDHTEKQTLFQLLDVEREIDLHLTEHFAMTPAAAVSGYYFSHPNAQYFGTGKINADQVEAYAKRKGLSVKEIERWLAPVLGY